MIRPSSQADARSNLDVAVAAGERALVSRQRMAADSDQIDGLVTERTNLRGARALLDPLDASRGSSAT